MSTRVMTDAEARFIMHAVGGDPLIASYLDNQAAAGYDMRQTMGNMPVCPRCEKLAMYHEQGIICPSCSYKGAKPNMMMKHHIQRGMYR